MSYLQLIINPGSTSTKLALYEDDRRLLQQSIGHRSQELLGFAHIGDQVPYRLALIRDFMDQNQIRPGDLACVVGRGGLVYGLHTGGYLVDEGLCRALVDPVLSQPHASNLGGLLAYAIAAPLGIPAWIYDAVTSGDLRPVARITGLPEIRRRSFCHVLNSRAQAIRYAESVGRPYEALNLVVVHLGGGVSASVHAHGAIVDSVGDDDGQFSPERAGCFPSLGLVKLCYSGKYTQAEMNRLIRGKGGMYAYLGTSDCREIEARIAAGDTLAREVFEAQAYQIAKTIGLLSVVLRGNCDAILLTGGMAHSQALTDQIRSYVAHLAPVVVLPGENEMEALAQGGLRLLTGRETASIYQVPPKEELL